jgi:hypothetical protein
MAYQGRGQVIFQENPAKSEKLYAQWISGHALPLLGVRAVIGRTLTAEDDRAAQPVAVISHSLWERRFSRDPNILGQDSLAPSPAYSRIYGRRVRCGAPERSKTRTRIGFVFGAD